MSKMKEMYCCAYCIHMYSKFGFCRCSLHDVMIDDKHTNVCDSYECNVNFELKGE